MIPVFVAGFGLAFVVAFADRLYNGDHGSLAWPLIWAACVGALPAPFMMVSNEGRLSRNFESLAQYNAYARALRTGELPADVDPDLWRTWLSRSRRANRLGPLWIPLLVGFGVLPSLITGSPYWVTATAFGLMAIQSMIAWWRRRGEIARLAAEVERHAPGDLLEQDN